MYFIMYLYFDKHSKEAQEDNGKVFDTRATNSTIPTGRKPAKTCLNQHNLH